MGLYEEHLPPRVVDMTCGAGELHERPAHGIEPNDRAWRLAGPGIEAGTARIVRSGQSRSATSTRAPR